MALASEPVGLAVVMLDVLNCGDARKDEQRLAPYRSYGFEPLPNDPLRLFLPMATVKALFNEEP